jgi:hypothetical protein
MVVVSEEFAEVVEDILDEFLNGLEFWDEDDTKRLFESIGIEDREDTLIAEYIEEQISNESMARLIIRTLDYGPNQFHEKRALRASLNEMEEQLHHRRRQIVGYHTARVQGYIQLADIELITGDLNASREVYRILPGMLAKGSLPNTLTDSEYFPLRQLRYSLSSRFSLVSGLCEAIRGCGKLSSTVSVAYDVLTSDAMVRGASVVYFSDSSRPTTAQYDLGSETIRVGEPHYENIEGKILIGALRFDPVASYALTMGLDGATTAFTTPRVREGDRMVFYNSETGSSDVTLPVRRILTS